MYCICIQYIGCPINPDTLPEQVRGKRRAAARNSTRLMTAPVTVAPSHGRAGARVHTLTALQIKWAFDLQHSVRGNRSTRVSV